MRTGIEITLSGGGIKGGNARVELSGGGCRVAVVVVRLVVLVVVEVVTSRR